MRIKDLKEKLTREREEAPKDKVMEVALSDSYMIELRFDKSGAVMLAEQKALVMHAMDTLGGLDELNGLLNMIDEIQDDLVESQGYPEEIVFPFSHGYTDDIDTTNYKIAMSSLLKALPLEDLPKYLNRHPDLDSVLKKFFREGGVL